MLCSVVVGYQCFGGCCYLHFQGEVQSSEALVSYHNTSQCCNPKDVGLNLHHHENLKYRKFKSSPF